MHLWGCSASRHRLCSVATLATLLPVRLKYLGLMRLAPYDRGVHVLLAPRLNMPNGVERARHSQSQPQHCRNIVGYRLTFGNAPLTPQSPPRQRGCGMRPGDTIPLAQSAFCPQFSRVTYSRSSPIDSSSLPLLSF